MITIILVGAAFYVGLQCGKPGTYMNVKWVSFKKNFQKNEN